MIKRIAAAAIGLAVAASPMAAQTVLLQDTFNTENGGATQLNYGSFANWTVQVSTDLIGGSNVYGISCVTGACVDLSGSTNSTAGGLTSKLSYSFAAGDVMRMEMMVRGNQRSSQSSDVLRIGASFTGAPDLTNIFVERNGVTKALTDRNGAVVVFDSYTFLGNDPYVSVAFQFTAKTAGSAQFQIASAATQANVGPILDNVTISRTSAAVPEPATALLLISGFAGIAAVRKRRVRES